MSQKKRLGIAISVAFLLVVIAFACKFLVKTADTGLKINASKVANLHALGKVAALPPVIGDVIKEGATDAGCWFARREKKANGKNVFVYEGPEDVWINIDGKDVGLSMVPSGKKVWTFKSAGVLVSIFPGPEHKNEYSCGTITQYPQAKMTVEHHGLQTMLSLKGQCGCW